MSDFTDQHERVLLLRELSAALIDIGDYERALAYLHEAERLTDQTHIVGVLTEILHFQALCAVRLDRWDDVALDHKLSIIAATSPYPASDISLLSPGADRLLYT